MKELKELFEAIWEFGAPIIAPIIGVGLSILGCTMIITSEFWISYIIGGIIAMGIGAAILTPLSGKIIPISRTVVRFFSICAVSMSLALILFAALSQDSGTHWSELSDVEKENARWAHEAKQYIDSID